MRFSAYIFEIHITDELGMAHNHFLKEFLPEEVVREEQEKSMKLEPHSDEVITIWTLDDEYVKVSSKSNPRMLMKADCFLSRIG